MESNNLLFLCSLFFVSDYLVVNSYELPDLKETTAEALPFHAVVRAKMVCNGILITNQHVITPAYCVYGSESATVHLGFRGYPHYMAHHTESNTQIISSSKIIIHGDFTKLNNQHYLNNIAIIKLSKPVTLSAKVRPGKLISRQEYHLLEGKYASVSGWIVGKDENKKIAKVQILNQDTCSYLFGGNEFLKSQEFCVKFLTKTRLNLLGNSVLIDDKIIGFQTNTPQCLKASSGCTQNDMVLNFIPFLDWMSHNMDIPIEEFTSKSHDCCDDHDSTKLEDLIMKINATLFDEFINFRKYHLDMAVLNNKIDSIQAELKNAKEQQSNIALSLNEQITAIATQITNNKIQVEQNIFKLQEELNSMKTETAGGFIAQQSLNDLQAQFIGLNDTVQQCNKSEEIQELTNKTKDLEEKLLIQKGEITILHSQLNSISTTLEEGQLALDEKFSHIDSSFNNISIAQNQVNTQLILNEAAFIVHKSHEKKAFTELEDRLNHNEITLEKSTTTVRTELDEIKELISEERHDLDQHIIKEFEQLHHIKNKISSLNETLTQLKKF